MKTLYKKPTILLLAVVGLITLSAGYHFETKLAQKYPALDLNDILD